MNNSFVAKSRIADFLPGQQGEICPIPGERVQGENKCVLHVWCPREENPRVQAATPQLPAHHRHVQPYVKSLVIKWRFHNPSHNLTCTNVEDSRPDQCSEQVKSTTCICHLNQVWSFSMQSSGCDNQDRSFMSSSVLCNMQFTLMLSFFASKTFTFLGTFPIKYVIPFYSTFHRKLAI